ncbi:MAG: polysaccharide pyruvyl transferase family protein [Oscillospiraceae bacterium]
MYNILISGYYGFDNIGDESILRTLVTSLRERIPDCSLTVLSHDPAATREKYGVEAVERMSPLAIARAVRRCDMLISGGGSLLQDVTSSKSLHYYLAIIRFRAAAGQEGVHLFAGHRPDREGRGPPRHGARAQACGRHRGA